MNNITTFVPSRDRFGRFKPSKKTVAKFIVLLVVVASFVTNYLLAKKFYVVKCSTGGYIMTKELCNRLYENEFAAQEVSRLERVANTELYDF